MTKPIMSHRELVTKILKDGSQFSNTRALMDVSVSFDMGEITRELREKHPSKDFLALTHLRFWHKPSSMRYALAESQWYTMATRDPKYIAKFGKIWLSMVDEDGLVNSNYGYQLMQHADSPREVSQRLSDSIWHAGFKHAQVTAMIADAENLKETHDTPCNNRIDIEFDSGILSAQIYSRAIDMIFGLPYDLFAAQGYLLSVQRWLRARGIKTTVGVITFHIVNAHIYYRDIGTVNLDADSAWECISFDDTAFGGTIFRKDTIQDTHIVDSDTKINSRDSDSNSYQHAMDSYSLQITNASSVQSVTRRVSHMLRDMRISDSELTRISEIALSSESRKGATVTPLNELVYLSRDAADPNKSLKLMVVEAPKARGF